MGTGHYVLFERIGVGGMAEVFRGSAYGAEGFERPIAIKRILPNLSEDPEFVRMFVDEAKIAVQLQHPNIVQVFDLGFSEAAYFIVMELVHGKDLRALIDAIETAGQKVPLAVVLHVAMKMCEALHHAHFATGRSGEFLAVVHRDVTPQNVLLSYDGEVKVTDFGLARARGRLTETQAGIIKGKLAYMAPEAFAGMAVDHRSDIYGVGILLWEMLAGKRLFVGKNDLETVQKAQAAHIPSLRSLDSNIPLEIERIVERALAHDREDRYRTAEQLHDALEAFAYDHQQFLTSSALASWFRGWFPTEAGGNARPASRGPERLAAQALFECDTQSDDDDLEDTTQRPLPKESVRRAAAFDDATRLVTPHESGPLLKDTLPEEDYTRAVAKAESAEPSSLSLSPLSSLEWDDDEATIVGASR